MEWIERLNQTINYIEEHLAEEIDYNKLGQIACCSTYHFQRMFTYMAGVYQAQEDVLSGCRITRGRGQNY